MGILGGTFDPIHYGHLRIAQEVMDEIGLSEVRFIPSANPPHKDRPTASAEQRAEMVKLAIQDNPAFRLDLIELNRSGPSYTIDTLISLRNDFPDATLCLIMGVDAFNSLCSWHRWQELLDYCHIILVNRFSTDLNLANHISSLYQKHITQDIAFLSNHSSGLIYHVPMPLLDISSSYIRKLVWKKKKITYLTPPLVEQYIHHTKLYPKSIE
jgi:nicotinate-nucleotide adenylyltransferase